MSDQQTILDMMEAAGAAQSARRRFLRMCGGAAVATGGLSLLAACGDDSDSGTGTGGATPTPTPTPSATPTTGAITDVDILNFALNLEYLEGAYYNLAAFGAPIAGNLMTGTGNQGAIQGGRKVAFTDPIVAEFAREIAYDETAHITFLRSQLGTSAVAQPTIDISAAFTAAAVAAGVIKSGQTFDPYSSDENFLIGAYLLTDVGVSAYRGSAKLITNKTFLEAAAGILATECYHDAAIRGTLYAKGVAPKPPIDILGTVQKISDARDSLDGSTDLDQGIGDLTTANIVPTDDNGLVLGRTATQVLNVVYLNKGPATSGGFFPYGVNGTIKASATQS